MTTEITKPLPILIANARATLDRATSAAEVLEAHDKASFAYDQAKSAERLAKAKGAHDELLETCRQMMADAADIEARAQVRLADEYDAAQARGEVQAGGRPKTIPNENSLPNVGDIGLTSKKIHNARKVRDAEKADPGVIKRTLDKAVKEKRAPSRSEVKRAVNQTLGKKPAPKPAPVKTPDDKGRVAGVDIKTDPEAWRKFVDRARSEGKSATAKIAELVTNEVEPPIDVSTLSLSAQEKLQAAINQETRRLKAQFDLEVERKVATRVKASEEYILAAARKREEADHDMLVAARRVVKVNGALMTKQTYKMIWSCLHADSRKSVSDDKLNRAFNAFEIMERLIGEEDPVFKSHIGFDLPTPEERAAQRARAKKKQPATANSMARK